MVDVVTREEFDELRSDVGEIKSTLNNHVLSTLEVHGHALNAHGEILKEHGETLKEHGETLKEHGERLDCIDEHLDALEVGQRGLQDELHLVKDGVDAIRAHFGV
ncbi:MAG: hypothetical protein F4062_04360 [Acidimicrobiia bacterium]|nr:hypothetical protein [Acidimicrobiia bacterium]